MAETRQNGLDKYISELYNSCHNYSSNISPTFSYGKICSIPSSLRDGKKRAAYNPRLISIGLIHHRTATEDMIKYKKLSVSRLLNTMHVVNEEWDKMCAKEMLELASRANECYPKDYQLEHEETAKVMLLDGLFILNVFGTWYDGIRWSDLNDIVHDLLLIENQIPFFILKALSKILNPNGHLFEQHIINFFSSQNNSHFKTWKVMPEEMQWEEWWEMQWKWGMLSTSGEEIQIDHILGLLHTCYRPPGVKTLKNIYDSNEMEFMIRRYSAHEIFTSGIKLKPSGNRNSYPDVSFKRPCLFSWFPSITPIFTFPWWVAIYIYKTIFSSPTPAATAPTILPVSMTASAVSVSCCWLSYVCQFFRRAALEIPELYITDSTESFLRNLIAYEQFTIDVPRYITSYAFLMDMIINTKEHVEILEKSGVLKNYLASSEAAADLFNSLCTNVTLGKKFYFSEEWKEVDAYCNLKWPSLLGSLRVTYFGNPWTGISVFAALVLFSFTGLQTVGTVVQTWYKD